MKFSIVVPTYNRADRLRKTLLSLERATVPAGWEVEVLVVDNKSTDQTRKVAEELKEEFGNVKLYYLFEERQGKSFALNSGLMLADGELVSGVDDDVEVAGNWYVETVKLFDKYGDKIDFAGGKMLPNWEIEPPCWVGPLKDGVISWRDYGDEEWWYGEGTPLLTGGHAVFRKRVFQEVGYFPTELGPNGKNLISSDDDVFYDMLLSAGKKGVYCPEMVVYHYVPAYRLSKSYYRQWCFGAGISRHLMEKYYKSSPGVKWLGLPRWMYGKALSDLWKVIIGRFYENEDILLAYENSILVFAGFFYGRHIQNTIFDKPLKTLTGMLIKGASR